MASPFLYRPNRFILFADHKGEELRTYVANPGKLQEILIPGVTEVILEHKPHTKTKWEAVGACWQSRWEGDPPRAVFLNTGKVNDIADRYLSAGLIPGLEEATIIKREHTVGNSRFDFLLDTPGGEMLLEVKSVTLVEHGVAMFPDATSARATKHVEELTELAIEGHRTGVLFMVQGRADFLLPDLHNDLDFARAIRTASDHIEIFAVTVSPTLGPDDELIFPDHPTRIPTPWERLDPILDDAGLYLAILEVPTETELTVGALGSFTFRPGFYTYVGSAQKALTKRLNRHSRKRKTKRWHIDYLRDIASSVTTLPIRGARDESALADQLAILGERFPNNFGATDCPDDGHLVYTPTDPIHTAPFQRLLTSWRAAVYKP